MPSMALAGLGFLALPALASDMPAVVRAPLPEQMAHAGLTMVRISENGVELGWVDDSEEETAYVAQRSTNNGPWKNMAVLPPNTTSATLTNPLVPGVDYRYRIVAMNGEGSGRHLVSAIANVGVMP